MKEEAHMWPGTLSRLEKHGKSKSERRENHFSACFTLKWRVCWGFFFLWSKGSVSKQVFLSPGGVLSSSPRPRSVKASFLSAKWHANGPPFPLLQSSITAVCWKHLCLSGCCWWTFISGAERAGTNQAFGFTNPGCSTFHTKFFDLDQPCWSLWNNSLREISISHRKKKANTQ